MIRVISVILIGVANLSSRSILYAIIITGCPDSISINNKLSMIPINHRHNEK